MTIMRLAALSALLLLLGGCGNSNEQEVQQWMEKTKHDTLASIPKLKEPKDFIPFSYDQKNVIDPFNPGKLQSAFNKLNPGNGNGLKPDLERRREALEAVPMDTLKMVGTITKGGVHYALIEVDGKGVSQVKAGNYLGQNYGLITKVSDEAIEIKEIFQDGSGDWAQRGQTLELQEAKK